MAAAAQVGRSAEPRRREELERPEARPVTRRAPQARRRAAQRARLTRAFVLFVICLTVLAVGRVALSFAVVQKTLQTDSVARAERRLSAENQQLAEQIANQGSSVNIRKIAETQLGLVDPTHVAYLKVHRTSTATQVAEAD